MIRIAFVAALALAVPGAASAQALSCAVPAATQRVRPDLPSSSQPRRNLPIGGYTLALSWSPQHCRERGRDASTRFQCGGRNRFGFVLHGLWPDGVGKDWPQYCRATGLLPQRVIRANLCATPSAQLLQHEWAKHGTCMTRATPAQYFARGTSLYRRVRYPDMDSLSRRSLTAKSFADAMARANPGLRADMMRVIATPRGWLDEVRVCLDKRFRYTRCPSRQDNLAPNASLKIWRGPR